MRFTLFCSAVLSVTLGGAGSLATAQEVEFGKTEFLQRCAVCHGDEGTGDGIVGELFEQRPANLQFLARENGGVFPFDVVMESIDGRRDIAGHGRTDMPVWGDYLMAESLENRNINAKDAAMVTHTRILAIAFYLHSLQVD